MNIEKKYKKKRNKVNEFLEIKKSYSLNKHSIRYRQSSTTTTTNQTMNIQIQGNIPLNIFIEPAKRNIRKNYQSTYDNQTLTSSKYLHASSLFLFFNSVPKRCTVIYEHQLCEGSLFRVYILRCWWSFRPF